jgi:hypothetical protein
MIAKRRRYHRCRQPEKVDVALHPFRWFRVTMRDKDERQPKLVEGMRIGGHVVPRLK